MESQSPESALERSAAVPVDLIDKNPDNPNVMTAREFDLLVANVQRTGGLVDPVWLRPIAGGRFRVIGGHHRLDAAVYLGMTEVPATIVRDPKFDDAEEDFQLVRMNAIRGKLNPEKFVKLYQKWATKYPADMMAELFGFADEDAFAKLIAQTKDALPQELKKKFAEAAKEIRTIDGLAALLNRLFNEYGDTLPCNFMFLDYGKQKSIWVTCKPAQWKKAKELADWCVANKIRLDEVMHTLIGELLDNDGWLNEVLVSGGQETGQDAPKAGAGDGESV